MITCAEVCKTPIFLPKSAHILSVGFLALGKFSAFTIAPERKLTLKITGVSEMLSSTSTLMLVQPQMPI